MIPFKYGTQEQYDAQVKDNSALYFISDTKRIYRGEELIAGVNALVVTTLPSFKDAIEDVIYILLDDNMAQLYVKGESTMTPVVSEVLDNSITNLDAFSPDLLVTSADDLSEADDNAIITAGAVKSALEKTSGVWEYLDGIEDSSRIYG